MLTDRQRWQIKKSIGVKHGFIAEKVDLINVRNVMKSLVIDGGSIEIEVEFSHPSGFWGSETFLIYPRDMRRSPFITS